MSKPLTVLCLVLVTAGCNQSQRDTAADREPATSAAPLYLAEVEPPGAQGVGQTRQSADDNDAVTLVGVIGGSTEPFVEGLAAFTIVDPKVPYCAPDEGCPTPWDYCCQVDAVKENIATVKVVDQTGAPVAVDARELLNVKELSTVVVQGTASRDQQHNLTIVANKVFVRSK